MSHYPMAAPLPPHGDDTGIEPDVPGTRKVDGERVLDPDANDDLIDSAEADRIAAGADDEG